MRRYLALLAATVIMAAVLALVARKPRAQQEIGVSPPPAAVVLALTVLDDELSPAIGSVPKDHAVDLRVNNATGRAVRLVLAGYEDRLALPALAPGDTLRARFVADRPGEDFAWLVDGRPAGRLHVLGSHLVEGHR